VSGGGERPHDRVEVVERRFGIRATDHQTLPEPQAAVRDLGEEALVDEPVAVGEHVPSREGELEVLPALAARERDEVEAGVLGEQLGGVVKPLEDVPAPAGQLTGVVDADARGRRSRTG